MWMRTYGCSSGPSRRPCSPLTTLIKHNWLLWTVWLYYRPNDTESVCACFTSASLLSNERRHKYCTICASMFIRCVCLLAENSATHEFLLHCPLPKGLFHSSFQPATLLVYLLYSVFDPGCLICSGSAQGLALTWSLAHAQWTLSGQNGWRRNWSHATHVNLCALLCVFSLDILFVEWKNLLL